MASSKFAEKMAAQMAESMGGNRVAGMGRLAEVAGRAGFAPTDDPENDGVRKDRNASLMRLDRIKAVTQVRTEFDEEAIRGLAESISQNELQQPIKVRWSAEDAMYVIVSGERRYRAMVLLGREEVPANITKETDPNRLRAMQLVENLHREDLKPMELARGFRAWMDDNNASAATTGRQFGVSEATVLRAVNLLNLPETVQARVETGEMSPTLANEISKAPAEHRQDIADRITSQSLTVAEASRVVEEVRTTRPATKRRGRGVKPNKPAPVTSRVFKGAGGLKLTAERSRGIDLVALLELLRGAVTQIEAEMTPDGESPSSTAA